MMCLTCYPAGVSILLVSAKSIIKENKFMIEKKVFLKKKTSQENTYTMATGIQRVILKKKVLEK
jgi:hypothetical protein